MDDEFEHSGFATVIDVSGDPGEVVLCPADDVLGGSPFRVPRVKFGLEVTIGDVVRGEFLSGGGDWLIDATRVGRASKVHLKRKGPGWETSPGRVHLDFPASAPEQSHRGALAGCDFWLFDRPTPDLGIPGHFQDGVGFLAARAQRLEEVERAKAERMQARELEAWPRSREFVADRFVSPYNFVPLPAVQPDRCAPAGHAQRRPDLLHGRVDVTLTALSPLLVRDKGSSRDDDGGDPLTHVPTRDGRRIVPGSSMKGSIRAAFEAITGSCLRVIDEDFVPAYRDVLRARNKAGWSLIEVVAVDREHRPTQVRVCDKPIWVVLDVLQHVLGEDGVRTGARFKLVGTPKSIGERAEVRSVDQVASASGTGGEEYVLMVTDVRARPKAKAVTFVAGRVPSAPTEVRVDNSCWRHFEAASDGAKDNSRGTTPVQPTIAFMIQTAKSHGRATRQRQGLDNPTSRVGLFPGHVLWARINRDAGQVVITDLSFAQTWRHAARGDATSIGDRIPAGFSACSGDEGLCPACRVFGSASTKGRTPQGNDRAYRGHVRLGEFRVDGQVEPVDLPPSGQPRPGSGQMYLTHKEIPAGVETRAGADKDALREWGSALDSTEPRPIRGRKFYWRVGDAPGRPPRWRRHQSQTGPENQGTMLARAEVVKPGATLSGTVTFENLTRAELGALLATLNPGLLRDHQHPGRARSDGRFCVSVGGGKPLGMGACVVTDLQVTTEGAAERYLGRAGTHPDVGDLVEAFVSETDPAVQQVWPDFLEMVRFDAVDPALVSYPREQPWPERPDDPRIYEAGFDWWKWSAGMPWDGLASRNADEHAKHSYLVLPQPTASDPRLPMQPEGPPIPDKISEQLRRPAQGPRP